MRETDLLILEAVRGARPPSGSPWLRVNCPLCALTQDKGDRKRSFGFNVNTRGYSCFRCGAHGRLRVEDESEAPVWEQVEIRHSPVQLPDEFVPLSHDRSTSLEPARAYLRSRKVSERMWYEAGIGACAAGYYGGRVIVPMFDASDDLRWFVGRSWVKKADRPYLYPRGDRVGFLYNEVALEEQTDVPVLVVEGVFDAIACWPHSVAALGKTQPEQVEALCRASRPVVFVPDGDDWWAGGWALSRLMRARGLRSGYVRLPPRVDPDEVELGELMRQATLSLDECED